MTRRPRRRWLSSGGNPSSILLRAARPCEWSGEALAAPFERPKWSALGPDGIPFIAWAALGEYGKALIFTAARHMGELEVVDVGAPNAPIVALLPEDEQGIDDGQDTDAARSLVSIRPQRLPKTDTKLMARTAKAGSWLRLWRKVVGNRDDLFEDG